MDRPLIYYVMHIIAFNPRTSHEAWIFTSYRDEAQRNRVAQLGSRRSVRAPVGGRVLTPELGVLSPHHSASAASFSWWSLSLGDGQRAAEQEEKAESTFSLGSSSRSVLIYRSLYSSFLSSSAFSFLLPQVLFVFFALSSESRQHA